MLLINQDRDAAVEFNQAKDIIQPLAMYSGDIFMGVNLICKRTLLGTFDTMKEAAIEKDSIMKSGREFYAVGGYSDWSEGM